MAGQPFNLSIGTIFELTGVSADGRRACERGLAAIAGLAAETDSGDLMKHTLVALRLWGMRPDGSTKGFDLVDMLKNRKGNCLEIAVLLLLLCREPERQMRVWNVPEHVYLSYEDRGGQIQYVEPLELSIISREVVEKRPGPCRALELPELLAEVGRAHILRLSADADARHVERVVKFCLESDPCSASTYNVLGIWQARRGDYDGARRSFCKALTADNVMASAHANLADCLINCGYYYAALMHAQYALSQPNVKPEFYLIHGKTLLMLGRYREARLLFAPFVRIPGVPFYLITCDFLLGDHRRVTETCDELMKQSGCPQEISRWRNVSIQSMDGDTPGSPAVCSEDITHPSADQHIRINYYLGELAFSAGDRNRAANLWLKYLKAGNDRSFEYIRTLRRYQDTHPLDYADLLSDL